MKLLPLLALLLSGCSFLSGAVEEDEAWAVRVSMDQVRVGLEAQKAQTIEGAEAQATFALDRSSRWADLGARLLINKAAAAGELTPEKVTEVMALAEEQRSKDRVVVMDHLAAIRDLRVWEATLRAWANVEAWTNSRLSAGETKRKMVETALDLKNKATGE